jgi:hypothetical protein
MNAADGSPLEAVLTSFSPTADVLAISSGDGRIKVSFHLASRYTRKATPRSMHTVLAVELCCCDLCRLRNY